MKKKPAAQPTAKELPWNNPFADLKLDLPKEPETPPPPPLCVRILFRLMRLHKAWQIISLLVLVCV